MKKAIVLLACCLVAVASLAWANEVRDIRPVDRFIPELTDRTGSCVLTQAPDTASVAGGFATFSGDAHAMYVNPETNQDGAGGCSAPFYPFHVTSVDFLIAVWPPDPPGDSTGVIGHTINYHLSISCPKDLASGSVTELCQGPGPEICGVDFTYTVTLDDWQNPGLPVINIPIECCVNQPFFVVLTPVSWSGDPTAFPSVVFHRAATAASMEDCATWSLFDLGLGYCWLANEFDYGCGAGCWPGPWFMWANGDAGYDCQPAPPCVALPNNYPGDDATDPLMIIDQGSIVVDLCQYTSDYDHRLDSPTANPNLRRFGGRAPDVVLGIEFDPLVYPVEACFAVTLTPLCPPDFSYFRLRTWLEDALGYLTDGTPAYPLFLEPQLYDMTAAGPVGCLFNFGDPFPYRALIFVDAQPGCCCPIEVTYAGDQPLPVELTSFTAVGGDGRVTLTWVTASERDLDFFQITRDGEIVDNVTATNSPTGHTYTLVDENVENGHTYTYHLAAYDLNGSVTAYPVGQSATPMASIVSEYALHQNFPNPFNPSTSISYAVKETGLVSLKVYTVDGREVATLVNGVQENGSYTVSFDGGDLASGVYLYTLNVNGFSATHKMVLMK